MTEKFTELAIQRVQWALQESYKHAVRLRGINDWTNDFNSEVEKAKAERDVEKYQIEIAKMILEETRE